MFFLKDKHPKNELFYWPCWATPLCGFPGSLKQVNSTGKDSQLAGGRPLVFVQVKELNQGVSGANLACGTGWTWAWECLVQSSTFWASCVLFFKQKNGLFWMCYIYDYESAVLNCGVKVYMWSSQFNIGMLAIKAVVKEDLKNSRSECDLKPDLVHCSTIWSTRPGTWSQYF